MFKNYSTKAKVLLNLESKIKKFKIPKFYFFQVSSWNLNQEYILNQIIKKFSINNNSYISSLVIRSSASDEDSEVSARAGEYLSVLNVPYNNKKKIKLAINQVIKSYKKKFSNNLEGSEIIVQQMIKKTAMSGVVFTYDLNTGAPYYAINYDDMSGLTDKVTSGAGEYSNRTLYIHRNFEKNLRSKRFKILIDSIKELEKITGSNFLDIEFALSKKLKPYLFQVRPITTKKKWFFSSKKKVDKILKINVKKFIKNIRPPSQIFGEHAVYGQMPDWNPVEMLGRTPRALALSLYEILITNKIWAVARDEMGYKDLSKFPLMITFAGQPFIDVRLSLNSFLPRKLNKKISKKMINFWLKKLTKKPELHDKIEFDLAITCFSFDIDKKIDLLLNTSISNKEKKIIIKEYQDHFQDLFLNEKSSVQNSINKIMYLKKKQTIYNNMKFNDPIEKINLLISDCKKYGTLPFSVLARHAFISKNILHSFISNKIITKKECQNFESSIKTIASELVDDINQLNSKNKKLFLSKYGHLRPGSYDIMSKRYDQMSNFGIAKDKKFLKRKKFFIFNQAQKNEIDRLIKIYKFRKLSSDKLIAYIKKSITYREYAKFIFTKNLSNILEEVAKFGKNIDLNREELSHIRINDILKIKGDLSKKQRNKLKLLSVQSKNFNQTISIIRLPQILFDKEGMRIIPFQVSIPNFITQKKIISKSVCIDSKERKKILKNKIVLIENADPGFDWIFSEKIVGLITKFGGANSHMAIRCAEFQIPAAIGCGEQRFETLKNANNILLDCSNSIVKKIN